MKSLEDLKRGAVQDSREEAAFFQALLDATVFVHMPVSDDSARLRLLQFVRPDGLTVLPFFSREDEAERAAQQAARVVAVTGRQLFEMTRGATLMLDPNETSCTLYPEEITAMLRDGTIARFEHFRLPEGERLEILPAAPSPGLIEIVREELQRFPSVASAHLAQMRRADSDGPFALVIVALVEDGQDEHMVRALATRLQSARDAFSAVIDVLTFDPATKPAWFGEAALEPFYERLRVPSD